MRCGPRGARPEQERFAAGRRSETLCHETP